MILGMEGSPIQSGPTPSGLLVKQVKTLDSTVTAEGGGKETSAAADHSEDVKDPRAITALGSWCR
ncbi:hypothetical protein D7V91_00505 [bacterium 1xD42-67]|nr:hypothetical protein D7V91_00505 [bacterium 1xD42-67]